MTAETSETDILILGHAPRAHAWLRTLPFTVHAASEASLAARPSGHGVCLILCAPATDPGALAGLRVRPALQDCALVALSSACDDGRVEFDDVIDLDASTAEAFVARIQATVNGARVRARRNARYRLLQQVDDTFRHLDDPRDSALAAAALMGRHLRVNRCAFADVETDEDTFNLTGDYNAGVPSMVGRYRFGQFGGACLRAMRQGEPWVVEDAETDPRTTGVLDAYRLMGIGAVICVPVRKDGRFVAAMAVHQVTPRRWRTDEVSLLAAVAERCWESIERGRIARTLQAGEARYRTLVETMSAVVWHMRDDRMEPGENPSWSAFTGQLAEEYAGSGWMDALHPHDRAATAAAWQSAVAHGHPYVASYRLRRHDGEYRHMLSRGAAVRAGETAVQWVGNCLDVTDIRNAQEALREADTRKDEFLAMLAHELRNPLAPIGAAAQVLAVAGGDQAKAALAGAVIGRQVRHMAGLVDDLLDVSRVKRGLVHLEKRHCDMAAVIAAAIEQVRPLVERRGHRLAVGLPDTAAVVDGDEKRLVQVLANLLNNAAKYTPDAGRIDVTLALAGASAVVTVRDSGMGMSAEFLERAFDVFTQADQSIARSQGGLGLGLALARSLVCAHGGAIEGSSDGLGKGAAFAVTLPLAVAA
ncbi:MAG TPA: ATP-binding protein [Pseudoduganella sp.]|jgi:PAS domain S-box-containing protein